MPSQHPPMSSDPNISSASAGSAHVEGEREDQPLPQPVDSYSTQDSEGDGGMADDMDYDDDDAADDDDYDHDEEDDEEPSLTEIIVGAWRQHLLAIIIAFVAAAAHHCYRNPNVLRFATGATSTIQDESSGLSAPTNHFHKTHGMHGMHQDGVASYAARGLMKHQHLEGYDRMANVSFCNDAVTPYSAENLKRVEFYVPPTLFGTLKMLYQADAVQDDFYQLVGQYDNHHAWDADIDSMQNEREGDDTNTRIRCLQMQQDAILQMQQQQQQNSGGWAHSSFSASSSNKKKIRGTSMYYQTPSLESMYNMEEHEASGDKGEMASIPDPRQGGVMGASQRRRKLVQPHLIFTGFAAKFVNLGPDPVLLHWDGHGGHDDSAKLVGEIAPFEAIGTATQPGHSFYVSPVYDSTHALERWVLTQDTALVFYQPEFDHDQHFGTGNDHGDISDGVDGSDSDTAMIAAKRRLRMLYDLQLLNQVYANDYMVVSRRTWLANFPRRPSILPMHDADYIGQTQDIVDHEGRSYRMEVLSVAPRVLQIDDFLSSEECEQIIQSAQQEGLHPSTLFGGGGGGTIAQRKTQDTSTRSSTNAWLPRELSVTTEAIYERAASVMRLDPTLLAKRHDENPRQHSIAEALQVVHYNAGGEEYQPHHDFVVPPVAHRYQPTRFATLLLYLNTVEGEGAETIFPRAMTKDKAEGISVRPKQGRAVLFYNMLPDGNVDELSQHGSSPTNEREEKWLANLWVWDPIID